MDIEAGDLDAAEAWLSPLVEREDFYPDDFSLFCTAKLQLCLARQELFPALHWLAFWEQQLPRDFRRQDWERRVGDLLDALEGDLDRDEDDGEL